MTSVQWVLCDLGQTLIRFDHATVAKRVIAFFKDNPGRVEEGGRVPSALQLYQFVFAADRSGESRNIRIDRGDIDLVDLVRDFREAFRVHITAQELTPLWSDIFTIVNHDVVDGMRRAQARGIKVAICSSTNAAHWDFVLEKYPELRGPWDDLFLSFRMGCAKPDPDFFPMIIRATGAPPESHVFLDDIRDNLDAARAAGMQAVLFKRKLPKHPAWD